jgi:hypothetical protein
VDGLARFDEIPEVQDALFVPVPAAEEGGLDYPHSGVILRGYTDDGPEERLGIADIFLVAKDGPDDVVVERGDELMFPGRLFVVVVSYILPPVLYMGFTCRFALIAGEKIRKKCQALFLR